MDWLAIFGIIISITGVILSLLLFNASVNNVRKIKINKILDNISNELFFMFTELEDKDFKVKQWNNFNKSIIKISRELDDISLNEKIAIPIIGHSTSFNNNEATQTFYIDKAYEDMVEYFNKRKIKGLDIFINYYDNKISMMQFFSQKRKYIRRFFIGPVIGINITAIRNTDVIRLNEKVSIPIPIKKIKNQRDMKKYFDECYMKLADYYSIFGIKKEKFERNEMDIINITEKGKEIPITFYR